MAALPHLGVEPKEAVGAKCYLRNGFAYFSVERELSDRLRQGWPAR
jgi:hypothetical protein